MSPLERAYLAQNQRLLASQIREGILMRLYARLRREIEAHGPVEPFKRVLDDHMAMLESCGYPDPLKAKS